MIVVADVFSNGTASLADVVQAPRDRQMLDDFELALRRKHAFVPASLDRRPDTMRVVFTVQKVDVREHRFLVSRLTAIRHQTCRSYCRQNFSFATPALTLSRAYRCSG